MKKNLRTSNEKYKARLEAMPLDELQALARLGDHNAKAALFRRTGIPNATTKEIRDKFKKENTNLRY